MKAALVRQLQGAYSGELAAAYAYRGHYRSRPAGAERTEIARVEQAEWHHRRLVGALLADLDAAPSRWREVLMFTIGRVAGLMCHVSGHFLPMFVAGRLEAMNVHQYAAAAQSAVALGLSHHEDQLIEMYEEEVRHEVFFAACVKGHRLLPLASRIGGWDPQRTPAERP